MLNKIRLKKSLKTFEAYSADETNYSFRLNANEFPFDYDEIFNLTKKEKAFLNEINIRNINRYPDPFQKELRSIILNNYNLKKGQILFGNGSDELILYILLTLTGKTSKVLYLDPSFSMYKILTKGLGLKGIGVPLTSEFKLNLKKVIKEIRLNDPDVIFIASPNNPTGNSFKKEDIIKIIECSKGIVVIDEAYSDYSSTSCIDLLRKNKNLLIMKTMSKIGFASLRLGFLLGDRAVISSINKLRLPYNISTFSQIIAYKFFQKPSVINGYIEEIKDQRTQLYDFLKTLPELKVFDSDSNFILIKLKKSKELYKFLTKKNIIIKNFFSVVRLQDCLRITIGTSKENKKLISSIRHFFKK